MDCRKIIFTLLRVRILENCRGNKRKRRIGMFKRCEIKETFQEKTKENGTKFYIDEAIIKQR